MTSFGQGFGRTSQTPRMGVPISCLANLDDTKWKHGGVTLDWSKVAAVSGADVVLEGGQVVAMGNKYLRYGQVVCLITASGSSHYLYGPYDPNATDGRQNLDDDTSFVIPETIIANGPNGFTTQSTTIVGAFNGGNVWKGRLLATSGTHSLASGPTYTEFLTAFHEVHLVTTDY